MNAIICPTCNQGFSPRIAKQRFCSKSCASKSRTGANAANWRGGAAAAICEQCGQGYTVPVSEVADGKRRFCSKRCKAAWQATLTGEQAHYWRGGPAQQTCQQCGSAFTAFQCEVRKGKGRFCSKHCHDLWAVGPNASAWKGGKSFEPYPPVFNTRFKRLIRTRDGYRCALCDAPDSMSVHHINYVKGDTTPANCITLCKHCHGKTNYNRAYWQAFFDGFMAAR